MGPHACMYVMCTEILLRYVMLVWMRTFNIYVRHDIMQKFPFLWCPTTCNVFDQVGPKGYVYEPV